MPLTTHQKQLVTANREQYPEIYPLLNFVEPRMARQQQTYRDELLGRLASARFHLECHQTKPHTGPLSPGCRLCALGSWSCLFVNGRCNLDCFYCPSRQDEIGQPTTNNLTFRSPAAYVAYLKAFNFQGMSLSGGEPLLTLNRTLDYLKAVKKQFGSRLHCWLYTNGSLLTPEIAAQLRDNGLDEIRFDIGALGYALDKLELAVGVIPTVTVEIPAVPEDRELLKTRLHAMDQLGVDFLNLHQLRLTPHNWPRFARRPYSYLHGEKITVLESELTALELMLYAQQQQLRLPVNYCSFIYKNRYQTVAARSRGAHIHRRPQEEITEAGYLRSCVISGSRVHLEPLVQRLRDADVPAEFWELSASAQQLFLTPAALPYLDASSLNLTLSYGETPVRASLSYRHPFREIKLTTDQKVAVERVKALELTLPVTSAGDFFAELATGKDGASFEGHDLWRQLLPYEKLQRGLQYYF